MILYVLQQLQLQAQVMKFGKLFFFLVYYIKKLSDSYCRSRRMQFIIPQLLSLIETCPAVKQIQAMVKPTIVISHFKSEQEKIALQNGVPPEEAKDMGLMGNLNPGTLNIIYHFIGIQLHESSKYLCAHAQKKKRAIPTYSLFFFFLDMDINLSEEIKTFYAILENKRNRHDEDLKCSVSAMKKIDVAKVMGIDTN